MFIYIYLGKRRWGGEARGYFPREDISCDYNYSNSVPPDFKERELFSALLVYCAEHEKIASAVVLFSFPGLLVRVKRIETLYRYHHLPFSRAMTVDVTSSRAVSSLVLGIGSFSPLAGFGLRRLQCLGRGNRAPKGNKRPY